MTHPIYQTVIIGGGFTGLFAALHLSQQHYPRTVILIDRNDRFCFKPLLYEYLSGEMDAEKVLPPYEELLKGSGVIFVRDSVDSIDLQQRQIQLASGDAYGYSNLVLALGSVTGFFGIKGAQENSLPFRDRVDAIALDLHLRGRLQQAIQLEQSAQRDRLLTIVVIGCGPSGVEMAATLADLVPQWYEAIGGTRSQIRIVLVIHSELLQGDINSHLRDTAERELETRTIPVELLFGAEVTAIHPQAVEYNQDGKTHTLAAETIIWTAGTTINSLIKSLLIPDRNRDKHGRLLVKSTLQLPDFPEVFAGGDCAIEIPRSSQHPAPLPQTAQVAYQQGYAIAHNLKEMVFDRPLEPVHVNLNGTLMKLGIKSSAANLFDKFEFTGEVGHLIRQCTYLELLPTPVHNFKATTEWLKDEIFKRHHDNALERLQITGK